MQVTRRNLLGFAGSLAGAGIGGGLGAGPALAFSSSRETGMDSAIDAVVGEEMARRGIPGLTLAIMHKGVPTCLRAYGRADIELDHAMQVGSMLQSASTGKMFTAAAILLLAREGRLTLDDPVTLHLKDAPSAWSSITLRHMMSHRSGLADLAPGRLDAKGRPVSPALDYDDAELLQMFAGWSPDFAPGARFSYNNVGYVLLGLAIKAVSGQFYGDYLQNRLFSPLGMQTARVNDTLAVVPERARGFMRTPDGTLIRPDSASRSLSRIAAGALLFSARDWMAWASALRSGRGLDTDALAESWRPTLFPDGSAPVINYGLGWFLLDVRGRRLVCHHGITSGFSSWIGYYPDDDLTISMMCNLVTGHPGQFAPRIAGLFDKRLGPRGVMADTGDAGQRRQAAIRSWLQGTPVRGASATDASHQRRAIGDFGEVGDMVPELLSTEGEDYLYQVRNAQTVGLVQIKMRGTSPHQVRMSQAWPAALYETVAPMKTEHGGLGDSEQ